MPRTLMLALLLAPLIAQGEIYKTTDENGNVVFSDHPQPGGTTEKVEMHPLNTSAPPAPVPGAQPATSGEKAEPAASEPGVVITSPVEGTIFPKGRGGNFSVVAAVEPRLGDNQRLQLYLDGEPYGDPQGSRTWGLTFVYRGAHQLVVSLEDVEGRQIASSAPVNITVLRASANTAP